jgi:hypothetical protein
MTKVYFVRCYVCDMWHRTTDVEFLNCEEDIQGRDVMEFVCPRGRSHVAETQKSNVFSSNIETVDLYGEQ